MLTQALRLSSLAAPLLLGACRDLTGVLDFFDSRLISVTVSAPQGPIVEVGDTVRLTASGQIGGLIGLLHYAPILDAVWATSDAAIARIEPLPPPPPEDSFPTARTLVRGVRPGAVRITATSGGVMGEATVRVIPPLATIQLSVAQPTIFLGDTVTVAAAALDFNGIHVTDVPLAFSSSGGVSLNGFDRTRARVIATAVGDASVSVRFRRVTGLLALTVHPRAP